MNARLDRPQKVTEPFLRMDPISGKRYVTQEYFREEWQRMWKRTWQIGGMAYQAPQPGDYLVADLGPESILLVRQKDKAFKAFFNVCPHRGARLLSGPDGHSDNITCPYHGWEFSTAGACTSVPAPSDFRQGSPCGKVHLKEIRCEELFGMVWFNMDPKASGLKEYLGPTIVDEINSYRMDKMIRVMNMTAAANCNWKTITDNFNEAYHVQVVHPELVPYIETAAEACQFDMLENGNNRGWFPSFQPNTLYAGDTVGEPLASLMTEWGLDPSKYKGREGFGRIRRDIQQQKRKLGPARGFKHYEHLSDYQLTDYVIYNLFPNSVITVGPDGVQLLRPRPHPTDPAKCLFDHWWLVPDIAGRNFTPSPAGGPDLPVEDAELETIAFGEKTLGRTADQDVTITCVQQSGIASDGLDNFYLCNQERRIQRFHEVLNDYMSRG